MSSYFDRVEQGMCEALERRARPPWYRRVLALGRTRTLTIVLAGLVIATPAVGAVTGWFGIGAPDRFSRPSSTLDQGAPLSATSELLPLRVPDPQGGPPWGLQLVRTTRGDVCIQAGRVERGELGSLGIDEAWDNDHLFHPFAKGAEGYECGTTDAAGHGFVNVSYSGKSASANPTAGVSGPQARGCRSPVESIPLPRPLSRLPARVRRAMRRAAAARSRIPLCPAGSNRFVFMGLLGPDAASITFQAPDGSLRKERTSGSDGAYLLVFQLDRATCNLYARGLLGQTECGGTETMGGASPDPNGAVKAITYRDGHTCQVAPMPPPSVLAAYQALVREARRLRARDRLPHARPAPAFAARFARFVAQHHLFARACPAVGYVAPKEKLVTAAMVAAPISVEIVPHSKWGPRVDVSFTAREPVTNSSSWYEEAVTDPRGCSSSGSAGQIDLGNVRAGQRLHSDEYLSRPPCKGTYHGLIGYMQDSGPVNQDASGGGTPGRDGSVLVGRFSFTVH